MAPAPLHLWLASLVSVGADQRKGGTIAGQEREWAGEDGLGGTWVGGLWEWGLALDSAIRPNPEAKLT